MNLASEWGLNAAGDPGRMGFFSSLQQRKGGTETNVTRHQLQWLISCSNPPRIMPIPSCQFRADSDRNRWTQQWNRRKAITDPSAPSPSLLPWPACTTLGGVLRDEIWRKNQGILSPDEAHQFGNLRASGHAFPRLISEMAVSSSFTHLNNDISPQAECYTRCQVTHFTVLILSEVTGATGLLTVQITFWEEQ